MPMPAQFEKLGKSLKDFFEKEFDYKYSIKNTNKASKGLKFETGGHNTATAVAGYTKVDYAHSEFGKVEAQVHTAGEPKDTNAKVTFNQLAKGLEVAASANASPDVGADVTYGQDAFALQLKNSTNVDLLKHSLAASATANVIDGLVLGGQVKLDGDNKALKLGDYPVGLEYSQSDFTATVTTAKKFEQIKAGYFHKIDGDTQAGAQLTSKLAKDKASFLLDFGVGRNLSKDSTVKLKGNSDGRAALSYVQKLVNPTTKFSFAYERSVLDEKDQKWGLGLHFGDY